MTQLPSKRTLANRSVERFYDPKLPQMLARIFGPPPLVADEDPKLYRELFCAIAAKREPYDIAEWFLVKDEVDLHWERSRERRLKADVIKIYQNEAAEGSGERELVISRADARL
jgi:hypothetical protein